MIHNKPRYIQPFTPTHPAGELIPPQDALPDLGELPSPDPLDSSGGSYERIYPCHPGLQ